MTFWWWTFPEYCRDLTVFLPLTLGVLSSTEDWPDQSSPAKLNINHFTFNIPAGHCWSYYIHNCTCKLSPLPDWIPPGTEKTPSFIFSSLTPCKPFPLNTWWMSWLINKFWVDVQEEVLGNSSRHFTGRTKDSFQIISLFI